MMPLENALTKQLGYYDLTILEDLKYLKRQESAKVIFIILLSPVQ